MVGVVVAGAVETAEGSEGDMVGVIALHQLLLQFKTNPNSLRLVGSENTSGT